MSLEIIDYPLEYFNFEATNDILRTAVQWRKERGYSIKGTAILLGIPVRTFYNWNSGMVRHLRPDYYNALFEHITTWSKPAYRYGVYLYKQHHPEAVPLKGTQEDETAVLSPLEISEKLEEETRRNLRW